MCRNAYGNIDKEQEEEYAKEANMTHVNALKMARSLLGSKDDPSKLGHAEFAKRAREVFGSESDAEELFRQVVSGGPDADEEEGVDVGSEKTGEEQLTEMSSTVGTKEQKRPDQIEVPYIRNFALGDAGVHSFSLFMIHARLQKKTLLALSI